MIIRTAFALLAALGLTLHAATPEQEKEFVAAYKKALEGKDAAALKGFLYTQGASPEAIEMSTMMQSMASEGTITSIELVALSKEEIAKSKETMPGPGGKKYKMPMAPYKALVIATETKSDNGSSKGSSRTPVIEVKGKLYVPVPVPAK